MESEDEVLHECNVFRYFGPELRNEGDEGLESVLLDGWFWF